MPRLDHMTTQEVRDLPPELAVAVLPLGSTEQHGPHLPLGTDTLIVTAVVEAAITGLAGSRVVMLPPVAVGKSNEHLQFPGTLSLTGNTLAGVVTDTARCLAKHGFRKLVLVTGHGGNAPVLEAVCRDLRVELGFLAFVTSPIVSAVRSAAGFTADDIHAGDYETSLLLALRPELVKLDRLPTHNPAGPLLPWLGKAKFSWTIQDLSSHGFVGDPQAASAEKGRALLAGGVQWLGDFLKRVAETPH
ncbi:MAG: creatininase family protein [Bacillota bacterium]